MEVIIPAGSSPGAMAVLAIVSEMSSNVAPKIILKGTSVRPFGPVSFRTMCGATSPTKPIVPPAHTAALTAREPHISTIILRWSTSTPREAAVFSPQLKRSSGRIIMSMRSTAIKEVGVIKSTSFQPRPLKLPKIQV